MITYHEAQKKIVQCVRPLSPERRPVQESIGCVIASDLRAPIDLPGFDNSAMDGFALKATDTTSASIENPARLEISGSICAGRSRKVHLKKGNAFRIMTGAAVPNGADAVIEKEKVIVQGGFILIREPVLKGRHIRYKGEEIHQGTRVDLFGMIVTPGVAGFLAGLGLEKIRVFRKPRVSLIATGDELVSCGQKLEDGQIYDSNTPMIHAALGRLSIVPVFTRRIKDRKDLLEKALLRALQQSDVLILTGGVSVGDYDHTKGVFKKFGVERIFWKVRQKPGKPVFFGKKKQALVFGLPGNPASVHACFYQYVYPAIRLLMGQKRAFLVEEKIPLSCEIRPDSEKTLFLKARIQRLNGALRAESLGHQGSHMLSSLCRSHGFIVVQPGNKNIKKGQKVYFHYLPEAVS